MKNNSEKSLMYAIWCWLATVVLGALIVWFAVSIADVVAMNKSIYKILPEERVSKLNETYDTFSLFYDRTRQAADAAVGKEDAAKYEKITYKRLYKYDRTINTIRHRGELKEKQEQAYMEQFIAPHEAAFQAEIEKWNQFLIDNDPNPYLNVTVHTGYRREEGWWSYYDRPDFYFSVEEPKGELTNAVITFRVLNSNGSVWNSFKYTLSELKSHYDKKSGEYFTHVDNASWWQSHTPEIIVNSITQGEKTLTNDAIKEVPACIIAYNQFPSQENKINVVRELIAPDCPEYEEWVSNAVEEQLKAADELCYEFSLRYMEEKSSEEDMSWMPTEEEIFEAEADMPE